jgi:hypothetical protein
MTLEFEYYLFLIILPYNNYEYSCSAFEEYYLLGYNRWLATCFHAGFLLRFPSTLKMEAICSFESSVDFQRTTLRYIPEDSTLHNHRCDKLKSYIVYF